MTESSENTSDMVEYIQFRSSGDAVLADSHRMPVSDRDLLDYVENKVDTTTISKYDYYLDTLGRREAVVHTGSAFGSDHHWDFAYNDRSELTTGDRRTGTTVGQGSATAAPHDFDYVYHNIGNRDTFTLDGGTAVTYSDNSVNQYTATSGGQSASFGYDNDGNLTSDDTFTYVWDEENRLIEVYPTSPGSGSQKLEFDYDYMSRRVRKQVFTYNTGTRDWNATAATELKFVYDEWNVVLVLDGNDSDAVDTKYTWGLDMSGLAGDGSVEGIHGAGGIGGLLAVEETGTEGTPEYWFLYDGNGNVGQVLDASDQSVDAQYEYTPYGNAIVASGTYAAANPFRFSTKYLDTEHAGIDSDSAVGDTGLYYYGYRFYAPNLGRWMSRDPIEEQGGYNVYSALNNNPINSADLLGMGIWDYLECVGNCIDDVNDEVSKVIAGLLAAGICASCPIPKACQLPGQTGCSSAMTKLNALLYRLGLNAGKWGTKVCKIVGKYGARASILVSGAIAGAIDVYCFGKCS